MYKQGEEIKLNTRPEWGIGTVTKVEHVTREGERDQRVWVKFPNVGMKTILAGAADIDRLSEESEEEDDTLIAREHAHESGWLGEIAKRRPEEAMTTLPPEATDPFRSVRARFEIVASLFRFRMEAGSLIDWAIAQTGMDDPLSRFNRHELEEFFRRWAWERDELARKLSSEAHRNGEQIDDLVNQTGLQIAKVLREKSSRV